MMGKSLKWIGTGALVLASLMATGCTPTTSVTTYKSGEPTMLVDIAKANDAASAAVIEFHVTNEGSTALKMLTWNTPIESMLSADVFTVMHNGEAMDYIGRKIKRGTPDDSHYVTIESGETVKANVDLATVYAMDTAGDYQVKYNPTEIAGVLQANQETPIRYSGTELTVTIEP